MAIHYIRPSLVGEPRDPFDCDEQVVKALVTVGAFVALADGRLDAIERDEAVSYIDRQQLAPTISRPRIADFFDAQARHLDGRDFSDLIRRWSTVVDYRERHSIIGSQNDETIITGI